MSSINKNIGKGIFYTAISKYSDIFISIIISAILARLLTPSEFGVVAIILVFISFFNLLSNFGFAPAIVQNKSLETKDIESIFSFTILLGILFSIIFFLAAPLVASVYENEALLNLSRLMALAIFFQTLQIVPRALLRKNLLFKQIGIISVTVHVVSGSIAIALAYLGHSYYALILNSIISGFLLFLSFYFIKPVKPALKINMASIRKIAKFSIYQFLFNFINYFSRNADNLLIGKFFGTSSLGFYDKAYRLMMIPVQNLTHVITPVLHPVLSEYHDNYDVIYNAYSKIVRILATIGFPVSVVLYFCAHEIINIMYGDQWNQSIPVFQILALSVGIQIVLSSTGSIFQATNRTDLMFYSGSLSAILMLSGISYGVFYGETLDSVGAGILIAFSINFFQGFYILIKVALKKSYLIFLKTLLFPIFTAIIMGVVLWLFETPKDIGLFISLIIKLLVSGLLFVVISSFSKINRELFNDYFIKKIRRSKI